MTSEPSPHHDIARSLLHGRSAAGAPAVSPDGAHVAVIVATIDVDENTTTSRIWLDGTPLTAGPHDAWPAFSPDGRRLAFVSRRGEDSGDATLHVMPVDGPGEVATICTLPEAISDLAWSPDGRWLGFCTRTRDERYDAKDVSWQPPRKIERFFARLNGEGWIVDRPNHVYVVAADGTGAPRNLTPGEFEHAGVSWLPDSSAVVTSGQRHDTWDLDLARDLYLVPLEGEIAALTAQTGDYSLPSLSPDGRHVAFVGFDDPLTWPQNARVGVIPVDGGERRWLTAALDRTFAPYPGARPPVWESDTTLLASVEDRGCVHLYRLFTDGRDPESVVGGPLLVTGFDAAAGTVATTRGTVSRTPDLWVARDGTDATQITDVSDDHRGWERFVVPCPDGGGEIDAWIMRPDGFDPDARCPVLVNVHGGPFGQYGEGFFDEAQMQAAAGFAVVMSNPRGGSGRDTAWGQSINAPQHPTAPGTGWGSVDVDDVLAVLDAALERYPFCDPDRVGMLGGSYGGYMATMLAARAGDRFAAICSERAANNIVTLELHSDAAGAFRTMVGPTVVEDPDAYRAMSPSELARDITVPMLIVHSEEDWRCPIGQAEELWMTLKVLGRDVTFYRFPGENHDLSRAGSPVHRQQRAEIILDWFTDKLAP